MEWLYIIITIISGIAAILAWLAKLRWSKEFAEAKDACIAAKEEQVRTLQLQIDQLRDLTPIKLREFYIKMKEQLEEYNDALQAELSKAKQEMCRKTETITELTGQGAAQVNLIADLNSEKQAIETKVRKLEAQVEQLKQRSPFLWSLPKMNWEFPELDSTVLSDISNSFKDLQNAWRHPIEIDTSHFQQLSANLQDSLKVWSFPVFYEPILYRQTFSDKSLVVSATENGNASASCGEKNSKQSPQPTK
jgi:flagellar basal body-associated protein FliL